MSGVSHVLFNNPLLTKLSQVVTLCGLEYYVSYVLTLCRLHYHVYHILTYYEGLAFIDVIYQPSIGYSLMCINPLRVQRVDSITCVSCITALWTRIPYFFYINLLIPRVSYVLFINPFRTSVTHVLILWGL